MGTEKHAIPWNKLTYDTRLAAIGRTSPSNSYEALQPFRAIEITNGRIALENASCTTTIVPILLGTLIAKTGARAGLDEATRPAWHQHGCTRSGAWRHTVPAPHARLALACPAALNRFYKPCSEDGRYPKCRLAQRVRT
jgi:hypothetical protein